MMEAAKLILGFNLLFIFQSTLLVFATAAAGYSRSNFPRDFVFGAATSAYQYEGAADKDGRTPSIWDTFTRNDIACDGYHKYKEDVQLMVDTGLDAYRFSISWSRLIPYGRGPVNVKGLRYYNNLINELIKNGIQPHVTLHHSDLAQALEDEYGGWINKKIVRDFTAYADICFREFGDRVLHWTTVNEANVFVLGGYDLGFLQPQRCSAPASPLNCSKGNSSTEPYMAAHNILLAHAAVAKLYKEKYQEKQHGLLGLNLFNYWYVPLTNTTEDITATQRANDFYIGWFLHPLVYGDYPSSMKKNAGSRLPAFTDSESKQIKGSLDFIGMNFYNTMYVKDQPSSLDIELRDHTEDMELKIIPYLHNTSSFEFPITPWALKGLLEYVKEAYGNPPIYIHENGQRMRPNSSLEDWPRVNSLNGYIGSVLDAIRNGSNTRGYFAWSLMDLFEMLDGYESSYGLYHVDLDDPTLRRVPKLSAKWYSEFLKGNYIDFNERKAKQERRHTFCSLFHIVSEQAMSGQGTLNVDPMKQEYIQSFGITLMVLAADVYSRNEFPSGFVFGASTSAYQYEGAANEDGRTPSIWDTFTHSGNMNGATADVACDGYHKYKEDIQLMVDTGLDAYRFSISWSRLIPNGRGPVNVKGLQYYNNLINELIKNGIQPHVTLHHSDLPQALEDERDFTAYADICFREFGDRVIHWTTVNEANVFVLFGYDFGLLPPQRCSAPVPFNCSKGNSATEPYMAVHNILLAHAAAASLYKEKYQVKQQGFIGINLLCNWFVPLTNTKGDITATQRANDFYIGWVVHPLVYGDYPSSIKKNAGSRLPAFTNLQSKQVKGSFDFIGLNFYFSMYVKDQPSSLEMEHRDVAADMALELILYQSNASAFEYPITPWGLKGILDYFKETYGNPPIYIHENGQRTRRNSSLEDWARVKSLDAYIGSVLDAIRSGSNTRGYFTWSFVDVYELLDGYKSSFGLYYVDIDDPNLTRYPKLSADWYSQFLKGEKSTDQIKLEVLHPKGLTSLNNARFSY